MPIFIEKFPPRAAQSPDAFGSQGDPAAHPDPMVQQVLERAKEESRAADMLERQLELDKRLQSFDAAYKQKYQGKAAVNADLVYDNMSEATLKEFSKGMSAKQMVDFRDQTWPQRSSFLGSGIDYGIAQDEAHKEDTGNAFLTRTLEIAKNPNLPQRDKDAAWHEYQAGRSKIQQRPDAAWQDDASAFRAARREGVLQRGLALAGSDPARAQGVFASAQVPAEFTGFFAEEEWQDASAQVLKAVGRARLDKAYAELSANSLVADESLPEKIKAFGLDADQEAMLGGMLEAKQKQADAATRKEREANLASLASGVLELAEGTAEQGPDLPAAYMLLAESDLDEATKSAALAGMRNGSFGQAQEPGAVDALAQQILSGQAGQAELATAILSGQISAQSRANLAQLHEEAGGELGPILRAWGNMATGDAFELGINIIRQKYEAGGLAATAPWLTSAEARRLAALTKPDATPSEAARHEDVPLGTDSYEDVYEKSGLAEKFAKADAETQSFARAAARQGFRNSAAGALALQRRIQEAELEAYGEGINEHTLTMLGNEDLLVDKVMGRRELVPKEQWREGGSEYYRPGIEWREGMSYAAARMLAEDYDQKIADQVIIDAATERHGVSAGALSLAIQLIADPASYIPGVAGAKAAGKGLSLAGKAAQAGISGGKAALVSSAAENALRMPLENSLGASANLGDYAAQVGLDTAAGAGLGVAGKALAAGAKKALGKKVAMAAESSASPGSAKKPDFTDYRSEAEMLARRDELRAIRPTPDDYLYKPAKEHVASSFKVIEKESRNLKNNLGVESVPVEITPGRWALRVDKMPPQPALPELEQKLGQMYEAMLAGQKDKVSLGLVGPEEAARIKACTGIDTLLNERTLHTDDIDHAFKRHGAEQTPGQKSISRQDFMRYAEVLLDPHDIEPGSSPKSIRYIRRYPDGTVYALEQQLQGKKLEFRTMWKRALGGVPVLLLEAKNMYEYENGKE